MIGDGVSLGRREHTLGRPSLNPVSALRLYDAPYSSPFQ
jgi:hypothetical protein